VIKHDAQAEQMKGSVGELMALVGGSGKVNTLSSADSSAKQRSYSNHNNLVAPPKSQNVGNKQVTVRKEVNPDKIIPMNEDFEDF